MNGLWADVREVSRPVFSFRPTLDDPEHKRAWEILQRVPNRQKNAFLVQAILQSEDSEKMAGMIRQVIREELKHTHFVSENRCRQKRMKFQCRCWISCLQWRMGCKGGGAVLKV